MNTIKNIFNNHFAWNVIMAVAGILLTGAYIIEGETFLAICWTIIAIANIGEAYLHSKEGK